MSKTAFAWLIAYVAAALLAFVHPFYGLFAYFLDYYNHPPLRWWGKDLPDLRWSLIISAVTLAAYLVTQNRLPKMRIKYHPQTKWLILFVLTSFMVTESPLAVWKAKSWDSFVDLSKFAVLYFLIIGIVRTKDHFRYLMLFQVLGIFHWGWLAYIDPKRKAGRLYGIGGADSIRDNGTAAHILAILPLIGSIFLTGTRREKFLCILAAPFIVNTLILANSRGAMIGLGLVGLVSLVLTKGVLRRKTALVLVLAAGLFYSLADQQFIDRQKTVQDYETDAAATERIESWKAALRLIQEHPFGTGGGGYSALSPVYIPEIVEAHEGQLRNVHNTFLLVASEWGILGFLFFMGFMVSTLRELHYIRKHAPPTPDGNSIRLHSLALTLGLAGVLTAGFFTNRLYAEVIYWLPAFTAALRNLQAEAIEEGQEA